MSCLVAVQWAWKTGLFVHGGAGVRKLRKRHAGKLADTTEKQNGHPYLKILPDKYEQCCCPVIYNLYSLISSFFHQLAWEMVIFHLNPES